MNGLRPSELNSTEGVSRIEEKLLTLKEAADFLRLSEKEVKDFVALGKIPAYKLGGEFLRFRKDQIEALQNRIQILKKRSISEDRAVSNEKGNEKIKYSVWEHIRNFIYFNDFYFLAAILILILLFIILRARG